MSWLVWSLVILVTAFAAIFGTAVLLERGNRSLERVRLLDQLDQAVTEQGYGPFPVDTSPLLFLSDKMAANVALEREIRQRCAEAEAKIPPRWRS